MYAYIKGTVAFCGSSYVALDVSGVGYKIIAPTRVLQNVKMGQELMLFTYLVVREDELSLYGFESEEEKAMFERLIGVSGIGPKVGMAVLSGLSAQDVAAAVVSGDMSAFSGVPGVGKKTAQRILLELKDKVDSAELVRTGEMPAAGGYSPQTEAVEALVSLGYARSEAAAAVGAVQALADSAEELTLLALKRLSL